MIVRQCASIAATRPNVVAAATYVHHAAAQLAVARTTV